MNNLTKICVLLAAGCALGDRSAAQESRQPQPVSDGKPLSAWIEALKAGGADDRVRAAEAIGRLGPRAKAAVPALREALTARQGQLPFAAGEALWKVDREVFGQILKDATTGSERWAVVLSLPRIGTAAKELTPLVLEVAAAVNDPDREHALLALGFIGADPAAAVPVLTAALQDDRAQYARMLSAQALGHFGRPAKEALPVLHQALRDRDPQVRVDAARAVWKIEQDPEKVLPVLTKALKEESPSAARQRAVRGLSDIGPGAKEAFPALLELWQAEQSNYLKGEIAKALKAIDAKAAGQAGVK